MISCFFQMSWTSSPTHLITGFVKESYFTLDDFLENEAANSQFNHDYVRRYAHVNALHHLSDRANVHLLHHVYVRDHLRASVHDGDDRHDGGRARLDCSRRVDKAIK